MTADQFLINFGYIATAPSGVKRLRELVLHLAVSGRLVPRISDEGEGHAFIAEAASLKDAYRAKHELRPSGSDRPLAENELEFDIPSHWKWERLGSIACYIQRGKGPKYDDAGKTRVVSQKCIQWSGFDLSAARRISEDSAKDYSHERFLVEGDILWNSTGTGTAGRLILFPGDKEQVVADSHVTIVRLTNFVPAYVWCYLVSPTIQQRMIPGQENSMVTGTTNQVELSTTKVSELPIPCAPIAEQKRIVAKVDELMALCDQLEAQQQERERRFPVLSRTCHARFADAPTSANLNRIFDKTGTVSPIDLRRTILTLAVQGRLIPQDPSDESTDACLLRLGIESTFKGDGVADSLPSSWRRLRFEDVAIVAGGVTLGRNLGDRKTVTLPYLRVANVKRGEIDLNVVKQVTIAEDEIDRYVLRENDLLMTEGGDWDKVGRAAIWKGQIPICLHQNHVFRSRFRSEEIMPVWFERYFNSPVGRSYFESASKQTTNLASINMRQVRGCPIPFPPVTEQRRIVAKVDELMALVDHLEAQQQERDKLAEAFAKACVASFTGTTQLEKPKKLKAPKTELVSLVTLGTQPKPGANAPLAHLLIQAKGTLPARSLWQQSGLTIDAFYHQLKTELTQGWIAPPKEAEMKVLEEPKESTYSTLTPALAATDAGGDEEDINRVKPKNKRS